MFRRHSTALFAISCSLAAPAAAYAECPVQPPTTKAFASIGDLADYSLAPGGDFETGAAGWTLKNAKVVDGNETFGILPGTKSIALGSGIASPGSSVTSPSFCIDESHPYFRFMLKANSAAGMLNVAVKYRSLFGTEAFQTVRTGVSYNASVGAWKPSSLNPLSINIPLVEGGNSATVQLVFSTPGNIGTSYLIDNVMVDPYRRS